MKRRIQIKSVFVKEVDSFVPPGRIIEAIWSSRRDEATGELVAGYQLTYEVSEDE